MRISCKVAFLLLFVAWPLARHGAAEELLIDGIAAQVGSEIVLLSEVRELARPVEDRMRAAGAPEAEVRGMHAEALERLIEAKLIAGVVRRLELEATEAEIDDAITGIAQDTGLTLEQLGRSVESHGLTIPEYREKIKSEIERSKVLNTMVRSRVRVEPADVKAAFDEQYGNQRSGGEEVHLRHILVAFGKEVMRDRRTACVIAEDAVRKIKGGEINFADMARRVTDMDPERAGEIGWLHLDDLASWMAPTVRQMQPGDVSEVIETPFGCNLLELVERRGFEPVRFEQAEQAITAELARLKMEREYINWLETLRKQVYVSRKGLYSQADRVDEMTSQSSEP